MLGLPSAPSRASPNSRIVERAVLGESGKTAVHSKILEWRKVNAAAVGGCTGHLTAVVLKRKGWHMAEKEGQS